MNDLQDIKISIYENCQLLELKNLAVDILLYKFLKEDDDREK